MPVRNIITICLIIILFAIALVGLAACSPNQSDYPWGAEQNGIKTRLTPLNKEYVLGKPIKFRMEMTNVSNAPITYHMAGRLQIMDSKGNRIECREITGQTCVSMEEPFIVPKETISFFSDYDITLNYHFCQPGKYTVRFMADDASVPSSNVLNIEIKSGAPDDHYDIQCSVFHILPKDWRIYLTDEFYIPDEIIKLRKQGLVVEKHFIMLMRPQKGVINYVLIWHTKTPLDLSKIMHGRASTAEYLGQDQWGYAYWEYTPKALELWPKAKEEIIKALEIKIK